MIEEIIYRTEHLIKRVIQDKLRGLLKNESAKNQDDYFQEFVIQKLLKKEQELIRIAQDPNGNLNGFVKTTARNYCIEQLRNKQSRGYGPQSGSNVQKHVEIDKTTTTSPDSLDWVRDIEVDKTELCTEYSNHFRECLNERDRMILHMHYSRDIKFITIEEITGINNVPQVKERAVNKIRAYLAENTLNEQSFREDLSILGLENILS